MKIAKRDIAAVGLIWALVLVGAFVLAAVGADDDPGTNEGAGAGALAAVVGGLLTGVYVLVRERRTAARKEEAALREGRPPPLKGSKLTRGQWAAIGISLGLWILGTTLALAIGVPDDLAPIVGGVPPLVYLLIRHHRRSRS